ncbi:MAG: threonine synthase [Candidatus Krumholzibacteriia bacterium]
MTEGLAPKSERIVGYRCVACDARSGYVGQPYRCRECGGVLDVLWDDERIARSFTRQLLAERRERSIWRYRELLPVERVENLTPLRIGCTPLYEVPALRGALGFPRLCVKDDGLNPTGSYKDRASAVGVAAALDAGLTVGACASTGNAASSFAGLGASMGLETVIFVPRSAPAPKVTQLLMYGARVFSVEGDYDETYDLSEQAIETYGWYNRNAAVNPFLVEGKKTAAFEIAEDLLFEPPEVCVVAVGDGCVVSSLYKGFTQLRALGLATRIPRLIGVQAAGADPLVRAFETGGAPRPQRATSYADSINVGRPRNGLKALQSVRGSCGAFVRVEDDAIRAAQRTLSRRVGLFGEPAGVASLAGLIEARERGLVDAAERIVVLVTGNGLKDVDGARSAVDDVTRVRPEMAALRRYLEGD